VALLRYILYLDATPELRATATAGLPPAWICVLVTLGFVVAMFTLAWRVAAVRSTGDAV
jgi:hypothetical protein